ANTVQVADAITRQVAVVQKELPPDLTLTIANDNSIMIRDSVNDVLFNILYGGILAVIVVFLFLANIRSTLISAIALPTSIITSFLIMYILHFTLNIMTLLALSLAVGLLIDDAIVVIENIYRHMQQGEKPFEAARNATSEIGLAVMATTFTIVAVFVPVAFIPGIVGRIFYQFGITVSAAVLVSLFVAFTLTPMLSSRWLRKEDEELNPRGNPLQKGLYYFNHFFAVISNRYQKAIAWCLQHRKTIVIGAVTIFASSLFFMRFIGSSFFPSMDHGELSISVEAAPGSSLEQTVAICEHIESVMQKRPDVISTLTTIGAGNDPVTMGEVLIKLVKKTEREQTLEQIAAEARGQLAHIPGATISYSGGGGPGDNTKPVSFSVRGDNMTTLKWLSDQVEKILRNTEGAVDVTNSLEASKPEWRIRIDRDRASDLGVGIASVASTARYMVDGSVATTFQEGDNRYDVRVRLQGDDRTSLDNINSLTVRSTKKGSDGQDMLIPLQNVAGIETSSGPTKIKRYDRQRAISVEANLSGRVIGDVLKDALEKIHELNIPSGYSIGVTGQGEMQSEAFADMLMALLLAVVFVYFVLAAQFESFTHPLAIMLALPMSLIGAVFALIVFHSSLSIISIIGIIMLMGLVTKNGILLVDFTNVLRRRGIEMNEALVKAGAVRLRPILMTTMAMIFGMMPVALSMGEGSEMRSPMGQAVIGGLITSTLLTLFIVPVAYAIINDFSFRKLFRKRS
ncbi:efflux RND transporter permease subunit, partial [bacterium]|nr:efflux RND transporter permease subunit [bacterium]